MRIALPVLLFATALASGYAHADAVHDALSELTKCADIADATARLKCFDGAVARAKAALAGPTPQQTAKEEEAASAKAFGLPRPDKPVVKEEDFGKPPQPVETPKEITEIKASVREYGRTPRGKAIFILDNGQVWRQLDADNSLIIDPPAGTTMKVTIERGFMASYNLTIDGRNGLIKVQRLQ
jgi:hypothetical protein